MTYTEGKKTCTCQGIPAIRSGSLSHKRVSIIIFLSAEQQTLLAAAATASPEVAGLPGASLALISVCISLCVRRHRALSLAHSANFVFALYPALPVESSRAWRHWWRHRHRRPETSDKEGTTKNEGAPNIGRGGLIRKLFPYIHHA